MSTSYHVPLHLDSIGGNRASGILAGLLGPPQWTLGHWPKPSQLSHQGGPKSECPGNPWSTSYPDQAIPPGWLQHSMPQESPVQDTPACTYSSANHPNRVAQHAQESSQLKPAPAPAVPPRQPWYGTPQDPHSAPAPAPACLPKMLDTCKVTNKKFQIVVIKMPTELGRRVDKFNKNFKTDRKYFFKKSEQKNSIIEMKNTVERINSRLENGEEWIRNLEDR